MYIIKISRHGPKNDEYQTGFDLSNALLDPSRIPEIEEFARNMAKVLYGYSVEIESTPVDRAIATRDIVYKVMKEYPNVQVLDPTVNEFIGQFAIGTGGAPINLTSRAMSRLWNEGKKVHKYGLSDAEHQSLYNWCEIGFDTVPTEDPEDNGISLREMAWRIGSYVYNKLKEYKSGDKSTIAFGHSSSIESFLYLCLDMMGEEKGMLKRFEETGGALHPLTGITFKYDKSSGLYLEHFFGAPETELERKVIRFDMDILEKMDNLLRTKGRSNDISSNKGCLTPK